MTKANEMMTPNPSCCEQNDSIRDAVRIMKEKDVGVVPIVDENGQCCGIVTDRDICLEVILQDLDPAQTPLKQVMHTDLLTCTEDDDIEDVLNKMEKRQVKRILVVDENQRCAGIISEHDIADSPVNLEKVGEFVESVYS